MLVVGKHLDGDVQLWPEERERPFDVLHRPRQRLPILQHLAVEEIASRSGGKFTHVAYKGGAQAVTDLIAGRVDLGSFAAGSVLPLVN